MRLDHAGIAATDADELAGLYSDLLGAPVVHRERGDIRSVFLDVGDRYLEFLEPVDMDTDIGRYLREAGPGVHHLGFETADLSVALDHARELGIGLIDEEPREGAWGHEIAFLDPDSTGGVLVEFFEE
jgi:methylmalonyl-CoA/ethylmalonyl-CoA epimerase